MKERKTFKLNGTLDKEYILPCLKCSNETFHKVVASMNISESTDYLDYWQDYEIVSCMGCRETSFRSNWQFSEETEFDGEGNERPIQHVELFPGRILGRKELPDSDLLPRRIKSIYSETYKALVNSSPILSGVGMRALVEGICNEKGAAGRDLESKIDDLVRLSVLVKEGAELLHSTRIMGNTAAHDLTAASQEDLHLAMNLIEHLLMGVYILPKKAETLPKRKKSK